MYIEYNKNTGKYIYNGAVVHNVAADENLVGDGTQHHAMYAKWEVNKYTVKFDKNAEDATGTMANQLFDYDEEKALTANAFSVKSLTVCCSPVAIT